MMLVFLNHIRSIRYISFFCSSEVSRAMNSFFVILLILQ